MVTFPEAWDALTAALAEPADELTFRAVCSALDTWPWPGDDQEEAVAFAERARAGWPDEARVAPWSWLCAAAAGEDKPTWRLELAGLTHLDVSSNRLTARGIAALARSPHLTNLRHLN